MVIQSGHRRIAALGRQVKLVLQQSAQADFMPPAFLLLRGRRRPLARLLLSSSVIGRSLHRAAGSQHHVHAARWCSEMPTVEQRVRRCKQRHKWHSAQPLAARPGCWAGVQFGVCNRTTQLSIC